MKAGVLLALLLLDPLQAHAQGPPSLGVELGYARADFVGSGVTGVARREGALAGAYFRVPLATWLTIQQGILIASKGGATQTTDSTRVELDLVYLDFPLVVRSRLPALLGARLILLGGVAPGARIGCNVEFLQNGFSLLRTACDRATTAEFRTWDVSLIGGVGLGIPIERNELSLEARLSRGIRSVTDLGDVKNRSLDFLLSIPF